MGDQKLSIASFYRKYAATISIFLGLLSILTCLISIMREWVGLGILGLVAAYISLFIGRDIRKRIAKATESGQASDIPEDQKRLFSLGSYLKNSYFSPVLIIVLLITFGCAMAMVIFMNNLVK